MPISFLSTGRQAGRAKATTEWFAMILGILLYMAKRARAKDRTRFAFIDKIDGVVLKLAILGGAIFTVAYLAATNAILVLEVSQSLFDLIP
jgi:hypothetical protein